MRGAGFVGDVIGHAGAEGELGAVLVLDDDLAGDDEHDVAFAAPAVGDVFAAVVDEAKLDVAEFADAGGGGAGFAHEGGGGEFGPIDGAGGEIIELHWVSGCGESRPRFRREYSISGRKRRWEAIGRGAGIAYDGSFCRDLATLHTRRSGQGWMRAWLRVSGQTGPDKGAKK